MMFRRIRWILALIGLSLVAACGGSVAPGVEDSSLAKPQTPKWCDELSPDGSSYVTSSALIDDCEAAAGTCGPAPCDVGTAPHPQCSKRVACLTSSGEQAP